ncbi:MAG: hypothetical protein M0007_16490 [Actinomycetota bacterium]|jgi:hypothetical protein|nr:hypothetical protein [Actinomycetota bacterium]
MFDSVAPDRVPGRPAAPAPTGPATRRDPGALAVLGDLAGRIRPTAASASRLLPVHPALAPLLPEPGLRRGSTTTVAAAPGLEGALSVAMALVAAASTGGSWCAVVGVADLGAVAVDGIGVDLERLAIVPRPGPHWAEVTAELIDGVDAVVIRPPFAPRPAAARRLVARARERQSALVVILGRAGWPEPPDVRLTVASSRWEGTDRGAGHVRRRRLLVTGSGRRAAGRTRRCELWLPGESGEVGTAGSGTAGAPGPA